MFFDLVVKLAGDEGLRAVVCENFENAFNCWVSECSDEAEKFGQKKADVSRLTLNTITIEKMQEQDYSFNISAEYFYDISNQAKIVYIVKFRDGFVFYDDVFYIDKNEHTSNE